MKMKYFAIAHLFILLLPMPSARSEEMIYDWLIQNAVVYDGVSERGYPADILIKGDTIAKVGNLANEEALNVLDASGFAVAPGFIDAHTHSDFNPLIYPGIGNKISQGVTTEITGNCGMSAAPAGGKFTTMQKVWAREGVQIPQNIPWRTAGEYAGSLEAAGMENNQVMLAGHGNIRFSVMGDSSAKAGAEEIAAMKTLLAEQIQAGAAGISFGLVYLPGIFADENEIAELCRETAKFNGVCAFHMRSEGRDLVPSVKEVIEIGRKTGVKIQISHLKAAGSGNWEKISEVFRLIEEARQSGIKISADAYPYTASYAELAVVLPSEFYEMKNREAYFADPSHRKDILKKLREYYASAPRDWSKVLVASVVNESDRGWEGRSIADIAAGEKRSHEEVLLDVLIRNRFEVSAFSFSQSESVVDAVFDRPYVFVGSDSIADGTRIPHPRAYGSFPRYLSRYAGSAGRLSMAEAIKRITAFPAEHFGLADRGRIRYGGKADLVVFDPKAVRDRATYQTPKLAEDQGIVWVFVNGTPVLMNGKPTSARPGKVLQSTAAVTV